MIQNPRDNTKYLIAGLVAASLVAAFTLATAATAFAATFLNVDHAIVAFSMSNAMTSLFQAGAAIPKNGAGGAFGYGVFTTDGDSLAVITTHKGVLDSSAQSSANDPKWHAHLVMLQDGTADKCLANPNVNLGPLEVKALTLHPPAGTFVGGNIATFFGAPHTYTGTDALSNTVMTFHRGSAGATGISFVLDPKLNSAGGLQAVCVEQVTPATTTEVIGPGP